MVAGIMADRTTPDRIVIAAAVDRLIYGDGALICYDSGGTPIRMDIRFNRSFRLLWSPVVMMVPGWKSWKVPDTRAGA